MTAPVTPVSDSDHTAHPSLGKRPWVIGGAVAAVVLVAGGIVFALHKPAPPKEEPVSEVPRMDGDVIRFTPGFAERAHLKVGNPVREPLAPTVDVTGTVDFDAEKVASVGARISGRVRQVLKFDGDAVERGAVLADIESAALGEAQAALLSARAHAEAAAADDARMKDLEEAHAASKRDAERAHATAKNADADLLASQLRLRAYGGEPDGETGVLRLRSPLAGKITQRTVSRGQTVDPTLTAFVVADLSQLWVLLSVFERELPFVKEGDEATLTVQDGSQTKVKGRVAHVGEVIDRETRSAPVRVVVDNPDGQLRPGQSVLAHIRSSVVEPPMVVVPRAAVVSVDGKQMVFVSKDATSVVSRPVEVGDKDTNRVEITKGLAEHEPIVVEGAFALKSELFR